MDQPIIDRSDAVHRRILDAIVVRELDLTGMSMRMHWPVVGSCHAPACVEWRALF
jgi:hypothetical protein